jgi:hypothetical protein
MITLSQLFTFAPKIWSSLLNSSTGLHNPKSVIKQEVFSMPFKIFPE